MAREPPATALFFNELARTFDQGGGAAKHLGQRPRVRYRALAGELPADVGHRPVVATQHTAQGRHFAA